MRLSGDEMGLIRRFIGAHAAQLFYTALGAAFVAALVGFGARLYFDGKADGIRVMQSKLDAANAKISQMMADAAVAEAEYASNLNEAARKYQDLREAKSKEVEKRYAAVKQIVEKPVYRNVCLDPDGLRELNGAIRAANGGASEGVDRAVPPVE